LLDEQGRLYVTGRKKDLIIHQGRNFYGHEIAARIEQLAEAPRGKVAVFSVDQDEQERVVVMSGPPRSAARARPSGPSPPARPRDGASSQDAQDGLPRYKEAVRKLVLKEFGLPVHAVQVVRKIPKTTSGKVARQVCRRLYLEAEGRDLL
jgi:acyl-CoA synthetase (AMP-forming)/AMP-acid ligase II